MEQKFLTDPITGTLGDQLRFSETFLPSALQQAEGQTWNFPLLQQRKFWRE